MDILNFSSMAKTMQVSATKQAGRCRAAAQSRLRCMECRRQNGMRDRACHGSGVCGNGGAGRRPRARIYRGKGHELCGTVVSCVRAVVWRANGSMKGKSWGSFSCDLDQMKLASC